MAILGLVFGLVGCDDDEEGSTGTIAVAVSGLEGESGSELAGVLLSDIRAGGIAVAGFAVVVDADPFSRIETLGNVSPEWGEETEESEGWPWPSGVASIPAGTYTLRVALGNDYCCYGRWLPAAAPGLRLCEGEIATTGKDEVIEITDIPAIGGEKAVCGFGSPNPE